MEEQLNKLKLDYEFVEAVDGYNLTDNFIAEMCDLEAIERRPTWLSKGAIGCALSHYNIYKKIVEEKIEKAIILEDDMILDNSFSVVSEAIGNKMAESEVVLLYYTTTKLLELSNINKEALIGEFTLSYPSRVHPSMTTGAYIITFEVAKNLSELILPIRVTADQWKYFHENGAFKILRCCYPYLASSAFLKSEIDYVDYSTLIGKIVKLVDKYKVFPFVQLLRKRRKKLQLRMRNVAFMNEASPLSADLA